jgi:hypothetical protein
MPGTVHRMEPDRASIEDEAGDICQRARAEASGFREMDLVADFASSPFFFIDIDRNLGIAALRTSATTASKTIGEMSSMLDDI